MTLCWSMAEITRLSGDGDWIDLDFVERERTPELAMKLGIQIHLAGLSLSNTISALDSLGVKWSRKAVHDRVQKADLQPTSGKTPTRVAVDETVIGLIINSSGCTPPRIHRRTNYSIYGCFRPLQLLLLKSFSTNCGRDTISNPLCFSSRAPNISKPHSNELDSDFRQNATEIGMPSNVSFEK